MNDDQSSVTCSQTHFSKSRISLISSLISQYVEFHEFHICFLFVSGRFVLINCKIKFDVCNSYRGDDDTKIITDGFASSNLNDRYDGVE